MYKCRKVKCPCCGHEFMWMSGQSGQNTVYEYLDKESVKLLDDAICPDCGKVCLLQEGILTGLRADDQRIDKHGIRLTTNTVLLTAWMRSGLAISGMRVARDQYLRP